MSERSDNMAYEALQEALTKSIYENLQREQKLWNKMLDAQRRGHHKKADSTDLIAFKRWKLLFMQLLHEGENAGWLEIYDDTVVYSEPIGPWVYDETEEEWAERTGQDPNAKFVTFPLLRGLSDEEPA